MKAQWVNYLNANLRSGTFREIGLASSSCLAIVADSLDAAVGGKERRMAAPNREPTTLALGHAIAGDLIAAMVAVTYMIRDSMLANYLPLLSTVSQLRSAAEK
jgi:hypothetical protein